MFKALFRDANINKWHATEELEGNEFGSGK